MKRIMEMENCDNTRNPLSRVLRIPLKFLPFKNMDHFEG